MNAWEGQVLAIAVKELLEAAKTLGRDGFGFKKDKTLLSTVIRDLLSERPNIPSAQATLKRVESLGPQPSSDYYVARDLLAKVQRNSSSREPLARRTLPHLPAERAGVRGVPLLSLRPPDPPIIRFP